MHPQAFSSPGLLAQLQNQLQNPHGAWGALLPPAAGAQPSPSQPGQGTPRGGGHPGAGDGAGPLERGGAAGSPPWGGGQADGADWSRAQARGKAGGGGWGAQRAGALPLSFIRHGGLLPIPTCPLPHHTPHPTNAGPRRRRLAQPPAKAFTQTPPPSPPPHPQNTHNTDRVHEHPHPTHPCPPNPTQPTHASRLDLAQSPGGAGWLSHLLERLAALEARAVHPGPLSDGGGGAGGGGGGVGGPTPAELSARLAGLEEQQRALATEVRACVGCVHARGACVLHVCVWVRGTVRVLVRACPYVCERARSASGLLDGPVVKAGV
jgi:hypothetical protein